MTTRLIRTLIVDDDASVCQLHRRYLDGLEGFTVAGTAATGADAVSFAAENDVDLILLDMHLPDYSGIEVLHRLRALTRDVIDIIVVTSAQEPVTVRQAAAARVADYLVKPFSRAVFELRLRAYRAEFGARPDRAGPGVLHQDEIDSLLRPPTPPGTPPAPVGAGRRADGAGPPATGRLALPKGLAEPTAVLLLTAVGSREVSSVAELAADCGLARGTARRYLDFLRAAGRVNITHRYGARGRPELLYSLAPG